MKSYCTFHVGATLVELAIFLALINAFGFLLFREFTLAFVMLDIAIFIIFLKHVVQQKEFSESMRDECVEVLRSGFLSFVFMAVIASFIERRKICGDLLFIEEKNERRRH